jgi:hypothetical protein
VQEPPVTAGVSSHRASEIALVSPPADSAEPDSEEPRLSPFLRTHRWAAVPGARYYYPSSCATLKFTDLVYFRTQAKARAAGFVPAPGLDCQ